MESAVDMVVYVIPSAGSWWTEMSAGFSAVAAFFSAVIAAGALCFSLAQMKKHEQHNKLMATPHLSSWPHIDADERVYKYTLENAGIGPAVVRKITLLVDNQVISGRGPRMVENALSILLTGTEANYGHEMFVEGALIPPGKQFEIIHIVHADNDIGPIAQMIEERAQLMIEYDSILGDHYSFDSKTD